MGLLTNYYIIKHFGNSKKMLLEGIDGRVVDYDPSFRNLVLNARKHNKAIRLPSDIKKSKLAGVVDMELFEAARTEYNKSKETNDQ
jgi:hypothetical protein